MKIRTLATILIGCFLIGKAFTATAQDKPKKNRIKITVEKDGKKETIDEEFEGEMPAALKERLEKLGVDADEKTNSALRSKIQNIEIIRSFDGEKIRFLSDSAMKGHKFHFLDGDKDIRILMDSTKGHKFHFFHGDGNVTFDSNPNLFNRPLDEKTLDSLKERIKNGEQIYWNSGNGHKKIVIFKKVRITDVEKGDKNAPARSEDGKPFGKDMTDLTLYPNPTDGELNINFSLKEKGDTKITLTDGAGREVYKETIKDFSGTYQKAINLSSEGKGMYFLSVEQGRKVMTKKIVLE